jgi:integrase
MKFTDRYLQSIKHPVKEYCIREGHGFTLRVLPSGLKVFQYVFTLIGRRHRLNLGHYPLTTLSEAREKYHEAFLLVSKGINPQTPVVTIEADTPFTVATLVKQYKQFTEQHFAASTSSETVRTLDKYLLPAWGNRNIEEIRRRDAIALIEPLAINAPGQARGVMKIARAMFNYALDRELVELNPFTRLSVAIPSVKPTSTSRVLSDLEIKTVWNILLSKAAPGTPDTRRALMLVLVTGQRPGEVAGMAWDDISYGVGKPRCNECQRCGWWTIPVEHIKTRNKRKEDHRVFLSPFALTLIGSNPEYSPYVFLGSSPTSPICRHALSHLVCKETEGGRPTGNGKKSESRSEYFGFPRWTPNDLRRTAATKLSEIDCPDEIIDAILNHGKKGVIGIYNRNKYDKEKQEWLTKWSEHLDGLVK